MRKNKSPLSKSVAYTYIALGRVASFLCPKYSAKSHRVGYMKFDKKKIEMLERRGFEIVKIKRLPIGFMATHKFIKHRDLDSFLQVIYLWWRRIEYGKME